MQSWPGIVRSQGKEEKGGDHPPCRMSTFGSDEEVRRVPVSVQSRTGRYGVHIRGIRAKSTELRLSRILLYALRSSLYALGIGREGLGVGIIDMGLGE